MDPVVLDIRDVESWAYWSPETYSLRPKIQVILGILGQINKKVKW